MLFMSLRSCSKYSMNLRVSTTLPQLISPTLYNASVRWMLRLQYCYHGNLQMTDFSLTNICCKIYSSVSRLPFSMFCLCFLFHNLISLIWRFIYFWWIDVSFYSFVCVCLSNFMRIILSSSQNFMRIIL